MARPVPPSATGIVSGSPVREGVGEGAGASSSSPAAPWAEGSRRQDAPADPALVALWHQLLVPLLVALPEVGVNRAEAEGALRRAFTTLERQWGIFQARDLLTWVLILVDFEVRQCRQARAGADAPVPPALPRARLEHMVSEVTATMEAPGVAEIVPGGLCGPLDQARIRELRERLEHVLGADRGEVADHVRP